MTDLTPTEAFSTRRALREARLAAAATLAYGTAIDPGPVEATVAAVADAGPAGSVEATVAGVAPVVTDPSPIAADPSPVAADAAPHAVAPSAPAAVDAARPAPATSVSATATSALRDRSGRARVSREHPNGAHVARSRPPRVDVARRRSGGRWRRVGAASFSIVVMGVVGVMAVGLTTPATALDATDEGIVHATGTLTLADRETGGGDAENYVATDGGQGTQEFVSTSGSGVSLGRGLYSTVVNEPKVTVRPGRVNSGSILLNAAEEAADGEYNATTDTGYNAAGWGANPSPIPAGFTIVSNKWFVNDPGGAVQWPFAVGCPITYGFGWRPGEFHEGADFTPGQGAPIQSIAAGTVRLAQNSYAGYGATVIIDHLVGGQLVSSLYAHMILGSIRVTPGEQVSAGQVIGQVGATGEAIGANMHFEILQNGTTPVDPVAWLRQHAGP